jgi:hypothetical protein
MWSSILASPVIARRTIDESATCPLRYCLCRREYDYSRNAGRRTLVMFWNRSTGARNSRFSFLLKRNQFTSAFGISPFSPSGAPYGQRPSPAGTAHATRPRTNWPGLVTRVNSSPRPRRSSSADRSPSNQARIRRAARYPLTLSGSFRSPAAQEDRLRLWLSQLHAFCADISRSVRSFTSRSRLRSRLTRGALVPPKGR